MSNHRICRPGSRTPSCAARERPGVCLTLVGQYFFILLAGSLFAGCGPVYTYLNNDEKFERRLTLPMSKEEVQHTLGTPSLMLQREEGRLLIWEYRLYPRYHWVRELVACPFTVWLGGCLFYPAIGVSDPSYPEGYYVVLYDDQLCTWGSREIVSESKTCRSKPQTPKFDAEPSSMAPPGSHPPP